MRVLFLSPIGHIGGAERVLLDLIAAIRSLSPQTDLHLLVLADGPLADSARLLGVHVTTLAADESVATLGDSTTDVGKIRLLARTLLAAPDTWFLARRLRKAIHQIAPDIIDSTGLKTHLLLGLAKPKNARRIWHVHDFIGSRPLAASLLRRVSRGVTAVAISHPVADDVRQWLPGADVRVVLNGIDTDRFSPGWSDGQWLDDRAGWKTSDQILRVGLVATYARWKGQEVLIRAAARLAQDASLQSVRFYIVGGPIYTTHGSQFSREELQQLIDSLGLRERVALIGRQDDPAAVYRALDIVVHASTKPEPFGLTIAEAMSCGRSVIVSSSGGASELFTPNEDAIGIRPGDVDAMSAAIARLAKDDELRAALGSHARATATSRFSRHRMAREVLLVYRSLWAV